MKKSKVNLKLLAISWTFLKSIFIVDVALADALADMSPGLTLLDRPTWSMGVCGFVELDMIADSTRSLAEISGNSPIDSPGKANGANGRLQFSIRNTRLGLTIKSPSIESWRTFGYIETDFLGFDPNPPGISGLTNTEASLFNNPTLRVRHAFLKSSYENFQILFGQTWQLFGWQPYYFINTTEVAPLPGMVYGRTAQVNGVQRVPILNAVTLELGASLGRPLQRDSLVPDLQAGIRVVFKERSAGFVSGPAGPLLLQPASFGISALARQITYPTGTGVGNSSSQVAAAIALDGMIPLIAASNTNPSSLGNTLALVGEFTTGSGYGDQFVGWTGNMANPLDSASVLPSKNLNLDAGIADYDANGNLNLVNLSTFNIHFQYHFPDSLRTFIGLGISWLYSSNMNNLLPQSGQTSGGKVPYNQESAGFGNIVHCFSDQIRLGFEYAHLETNYGDGSLGINNRYQLTTLFIF